MERNEFLTRFQLNRPAPTKSIRGRSDNYRDAAVLIALFEHRNQLQLLLTERSLQMPTHPGQVAFPGGKVDDSDGSFWEAATREAWEEIGLPPEQLSRVGTLPKIDTISQFRIWPQLAIIESPFEPILSTREVSRLFSVPLTDFLEPNLRWHLKVRRGNTIQPIYFMPHGVWGATAALIEQLAQQLGYAKAPIGP